MSFDPVQRFLGVASGAEPAELLGFASPPQSVHAVDEALRRRLAEVYNHPDGRADDAEVVRRALREAAATLKARLPQHDAHAQPRLIVPARPVLTAFDRNVLAILVGCGGWNAMSRARLIALAATNNVTGGGLLKVIAGLGQYARSTRFEMSQIKVRSIRADVIAAPTAPDLANEHNTEADERAAIWRTVKLSLFFGLLATVMGVVAVNQFAPRSAPRAEPAAAAPAPAAKSVPALTTEEPDDVAAPAEPQLIDWGVTRFSSDDQPTFYVPLPDAAIGAKRASAGAVSELEGVVARIGIAGPEGISEMVYRTWEDVLINVASCWPLLEEPARRTIERRVIDVLFTSAARGMTDAYDRLFRALDPPPAPATLSDPLELWIGAWRAAMLARVAFHPDLPHGVAERGRSHLDAGLGRTPGDDGRLTPVQAAAAWLERAEPALIAWLDEPHRAFAMWELWLTAQRRLGPRERYNGALVAAVRTMLVAETALLKDDGSPTPALAVIGRLLEEADFNASPSVRGQFLALFDDEGVSSRSLWIVTSRLAGAPNASWFNESFVLRSPDESIRRRLRQDVSRAWPVAALADAHDVRHPGSDVDPIAGAHWLDAAERMRAESVPMDRSDALLRQVVRAAQVGEAAAYLAVRTPARAERLLDEIVEAGDPAESGSDGARGGRMGRPIGTEGGWATAYEEARRDAEERLRLLRALRAQSGAGGDLWPADAAVLVREAYRGTPTEIRNVAQGAIVEAFKRGPNVGRELLDQLPDVPRTPALSQFLSQYAGGSLPPSRDVGWMIAARLTLIEHLLALVDEETPIVERIVDGLAATYANQASALRGTEPHETATAASPSAGATSLFNFWRERAHVHGASRLGGEVAAAERRHAARLQMAEGVIQRTIAMRIGALEMMAIATRGDFGSDGAMDRHIAHIIERHASEWRAAPNALAQALWVERATIALWRLRLVEPKDGSDVGMKMSPPDRAKMAGRSWPPAVHQLSNLILSTRLIERRSTQLWTERLEKLDPFDPLSYFILAEDLLDDAHSTESVSLAKHLFALAGSLDPARLGRSACLAIADLEEQSHLRRRLLALADLLAQDFGDGRLSPPVGNGEDDAPERRDAALAVAEAFSHFRQGNGTRAGQILRRDDVLSLLSSVESALPWRSVQTFVDEVAARRRRPSLSQIAFVRLLQIEKFLLGGGSGASGNEYGGALSWAAELHFTAGLPLIEVDPERLDEAFGVDAARPYWRSGRWVEQP